MSALRESQQALRVQLFRADVSLLSPRLQIYRNTCLSTLVKALQLSYPAVLRLVGADFFEAVARCYLDEELPQSAYLNDYGGGLPQFLQNFGPAQSVPYLPDVARLEWAVNRALHAPDALPLQIARLTGLNETDLSRLQLIAHPSLSVLSLRYPADQIWRAVLEQDDAAMGRIEFSHAPTHLLIERSMEGVQVQPLSATEADFTRALCAGTALGEAMGCRTDDSLQRLLAAHLACGRFIDLSLTGSRRSDSSPGEQHP